MKTPSLANLVTWTVATALTLMAATSVSAANRMYLATTAPDASNVDLATLTVTWESAISICCYRTTTFDQAAAGSYLSGYPSISW